MRRIRRSENPARLPLGHVAGRRAHPPHHPRLGGRGPWSGTPASPPPSWPTSGVPYLGGAWYTFTSDPWPRQFPCAGGEVDEAPRPPPVVGARRTAAARSPPFALKPDPRTPAPTEL